MKLYAIVTFPDNTIHQGKVYVNRPLLCRELEDYGYTVNSFGNIFYNRTKVGKIVTLKLIVE